jgi:hypothetical protein
MAVECPKCGLVNPDTSHRCDGGDDRPAITTEFTARVVGEAAARQQAESLQAGSRLAELATCPKCGARQVIPAMRVVDRGGELGDQRLSVRLDRNPEAWIFKGSEVVAKSKGDILKISCRARYFSRPGPPFMMPRALTPLAGLWLPKALDSLACRNGKPNH